MFVVTREWLEAHGKPIPNGGHAWTADQVRQLGTEMTQGWVWRALGTEITEQQKERFERALDYKQARKSLTGSLF
jgi:hypothetical protein